MQAEGTAPAETNKVVLLWSYKTFKSIIQTYTCPKTLCDLEAWGNLSILCNLN